MERESQKRQPAPPHNAVASYDFVLRCVVYPHKEAYTAECIDLDIAVRRESPEIAMRELKQALAGYIAVVVEADAAGLIPRPLPFWNRVRYHIYTLRAAFSIGRRRTLLVSDLTPLPLC